ncbi:FAD-dependent thymidylate synthase [Alkalihalobacillus sp. LMS6]|uniref:FAD-dependent thymidylate synthase n=1 Tax=Alkalihalobacillus sp. LMS6 TaxID=2924034 RepID=UPI0020D1CDE8|nr:FAD-dependent thymidylate synthase [Alkalihalobacillus sp. LMS6]UTR05176.1 FAD-dependent thymidylate synthase [Alkalihalobacillus sp. LMS6]
MDVKLLAHTALSDEFYERISRIWDDLSYNGSTDGQAVALSAIRTCYSPGKPSEIVAKEGARYFGSKATDGESGTEADRLFRMIFRSKHLSTLEHLTYTFAVEGVSRALLAQLTRHRVGFSFSVQSQRYVKFGSGDKSGGFDYVTPESVSASDKTLMGDDLEVYDANELFAKAMDDAQSNYDMLRKLGVPAEDARAVLPNAAACNLVMTVNLRSLLDFYAKRQKGRGGQHEITQLSEELRKSVVAVEPWTDQFFAEV